MSSNQKGKYAAQPSKRGVSLPGSNRRGQAPSSNQLSKIKGQSHVIVINSDCRSNLRWSHQNVISNPSHHRTMLASISHKSLLNISNLVNHRFKSNERSHLLHRGSDSLFQITHKHPPKEMSFKLYSSPKSPKGNY